MATWKLAPDTGQISGGPHSSMPLVVIPSDIEIGAITLAEAQSSRYYTDSGLVTEVAREVVSSDELHFDGSSVSSSSEYWMDFDGVRSDYAVTDTYGRNAVWGDYTFVTHDGGGTDSTGNYSISNNGGVTAGGATGNIGDATDYDGTDDYSQVAEAASLLDNQKFTVQSWFNSDAAGAGEVIFMHPEDNNVYPFRLSYGSGNTVEFYTRKDTSANQTILSGVTAAATSTWHMAHGVFDGLNTNQYIYLNGTEDASDLSTQSDVKTTNLNGLWIGAYYNSSNPSGVVFFNGKISETRLRHSALSANWILTEYKNQNSPSTFYITGAEETDGGGGVTRRVFIVS